MRILHIGNEMFWRGGENQVRLLVEGLKRYDVESIIAYPSGSRGLVRFQESAETLELPSRLAFDPRSVSRLREYCREKKVDILDAQSSGGMSLALSVKKAIPKLKFLVHRRVDNPIKTVWTSRRKYLSPLVDRYVCVSRAVAEIMINYGVPANKISVVHDAVDNAPYEKIDRDLAIKKWRARFPKPAETVWIGNASALSPQKAYDVLLRACKELQRKNLPFHCLIAGEGKLESDLKKQWSDLKLEGHVNFVGHIKDVPEFLSALDILAVPSNNEGLGSILLEGAHAGCALLGSRVGGIPEIIIDNETGVLVEVGDARSLADGLEKLIKNVELRKSLGARAREYVQSAFSLEKMVEGNLSIYRDLL